MRGKYPHGPQLLLFVTLDFHIYIILFKLAAEHFEVEKVPREEQDPVYNSDDIHIYEMRLKE